MKREPNVEFLAELTAHRRGRGHAPCKLMAGVSLTGDHQVILRSEDQSGVAAMVAALTPEAALELAGALIRSAQAAA